MVRSPCCCVLAACLLACAPALVAQQASSAASGRVADLDGPQSGWVNSGLGHDLERYTAAYPRPPVDRGRQKYRTLIEGRLREHMDERKPPTLVVNGNAMPLYADAQGQFARPYAFGAGSNSVELISADGSTHQRLQFYEAEGGKTQARMRAILSWDDAKAEVDLHVVSPEGHHAFWAEPQLAEGGGLDVDSVDGAGPEIFSSAAPEHGAWLFYVNYWGNFDQTGYNFNQAAHQRDLIMARLSLIYDENTVNERREFYVVPLRKVGELTLIKAIHY
jgi:uncharacterized protein YfaP (DUF2135 family)